MIVKSKTKKNTSLLFKNISSHNLLNIEELTSCKNRGGLGNDINKATNATA